LNCYVPIRHTPEKYALIFPFDSRVGLAFPASQSPRDEASTLASLANSRNHHPKGFPADSQPFPEVSGRPPGTEVQEVVDAGEATNPGFRGVSLPVENRGFARSQNLRHLFLEESQVHSPGPDLISKGLDFLGIRRVTGFLSS